MLCEMTIKEFFCLLGTLTIIVLYMGLLVFGLETAFRLTLRALG